MSKLQVIKMIFIEAIYSGFIGGAVGIFLGWVIMMNVPYLLEVMLMPPMGYFVANGLFIYLICAILVTVVSSVLPALKTSKLNIIEAIKFQ